MITFVARFDVSELALGRGGADGEFESNPHRTPIWVQLKLHFTPKTEKSNDHKS